LSAAPPPAPLPVPEPVFALDLPHGRCVGMAIPARLTDELAAALRPEERRLVEQMPAARQPSFAAGRAALRLALRQAGLADGPLLREQRGGPTLPPGALGSISHKTELAVALVTAAAVDDSAPNYIGVDLEISRRLRVDISRRVLTERELRRWKELPSGESRDHALMVSFSLKESFYKAVNAIVGGHVSFQHVEVDSIDEQGRAVFSGELFAQHPLHVAFHVEGWVGSPAPGLILSSARAGVYQEA
jgi:phosphopantetheine--protein transferase-like protein